MGAIRAVAIGASAGAVQALLHILPALPAGYPLPVFIVVHVPPDRRNALVPLFQSKCRILVKEAEDKEPALAGVVYFAPSDYHLLVEADGVAVAVLGRAGELFPPLHRRAVRERRRRLWPGAGRRDPHRRQSRRGAGPQGGRGRRAASLSSRTRGSAYAPTMPAAALSACPSAGVMSLEAIAS